MYWLAVQLRSLGGLNLGTLKTLRCVEVPLRCIDRHGQALIFSPDFAFLAQAADYDAKRRQSVRLRENAHIHSRALGEDERAQTPRSSSRLLAREYTQSRKAKAVPMQFRELLAATQHQRDPWSVDEVVAARMGEGCTSHDRDAILLEELTFRRFVLCSEMKARRPNHRVDMDAFIAVVREVYRERLGTPWENDTSPWQYRAVVERFMGEVMDRCQERRVRYHPGWLKCLYRLRDEIRRGLR